MLKIVRKYIEKIIFCPNETDLHFFSFPEITGYISQYFFVEISSGNFFRFFLIKISSGNLFRFFFNEISSGNFFRFFFQVTQHLPKCGQKFSTLKCDSKMVKSIVT
jgi:hypothetical protein